MAKVIRGAIWSLCRGVGAHSAPAQQASSSSGASTACGRQLTQQRAESQLVKGGSEAFRALRVLPEPAAGAKRLQKAQQELHICTSSLVQVTFSGGGQTVVSGRCCGSSLL